jgi:hypothetical protein
MHGQQSRGFLDGKLAVRARLHVKMRDTGVSFVEEIKFAGRTWAGTVQLVWLFISADYLHCTPP